MTAADECTRPPPKAPAARTTFLLPTPPQWNAGSVTFEVAWSERPARDLTDLSARSHRRLFTQKANT
jgi:hypothetical protein